MSGSQIQRTLKRSGSYWGTAGLSWKFYLFALGVSEKQVLIEAYVKRGLLKPTGEAQAVEVSGREVPA